MKLVWLSLAAACAWGAEMPQVFYSKSFPGSSPAFAAIRVDRQGQGDYRESAEEDGGLKFQLTAKEVEEVFGLTEKLGRFSRPLESGLKVANTGLKTFRYQSEKESHEVQFNYSLEEDARLLWDFFERVTETERLLVKLERAARYDRLGVNQALLELEVTRDRGRLVAAPQFLKVLDRIAKNEAYLHMARARAAKLAEFIRGGEAGSPQP